MRWHALKFKQAPTTFNSTTHTTELVMKSALLASALLLTATSVQAQLSQSVIAPTGTSVVAPSVTSGRSTENMSVTNGSRTTLSVGNSTSFGASANISASEGLTAVSRSVLVPASAAITSNIGSNPNTLGVTKINISNLTAKGGGTINPAAQGGIGTGTTIQSTDGQFASGDATIDGMGASVTMGIGPTTASPNSEASFFSIVHPNTASACSPTDKTACAYTQLNGLVTGNAGASANLSTQTNIDIQANSFTQTFAQSF